jgi:hypothetical protein
MSTVSQASNQRQHRFAGVRPLLKAALVDVGLRMIGSPHTGCRLTRCVQRVVTAIVIRAGLAGV